MIGPKALYFERRQTTHFACLYDPRFSYSLYIPENYSEEQTELCSLAVIVHGSMRNSQQYRDAFIDYAEKTNTIILAPLFPGSITAPWESDSYKFVRVDGVYFDKILLAMVDEVADRFKVKTEKFLLHGFSGGGQFSHRFFYLHPDRLLGVSIGAPGNITLLDSYKPWYIGVGDLESRYQTPVLLSEMQKVPILMVIGKEDTDTWMINDKNAPYWINDLENTGETRIERLRTLKNNYEENGIHVQYEMIDGVSHEAFKVLPTVKQFFEKVLAEVK
ncbi:hypothetical protein [Oceanobacillus jeddahense]|uniref:hypothetical protein n=1 Tax=Oceanobacillus jeddahense TaxID=1462527 RepID=UPI003638AC4A